MSGGVQTQMVISLVQFLFEKYANRAPAINEIMDEFGRELIERVRAVAKKLESQEGLTDEDRQELLLILAKDPRTIGVVHERGVGDAPPPPPPPASGEAAYGLTPFAPTVPPYDVRDRVFVGAGLNAFFVVPAGIGMRVPDGFTEVPDFFRGGSGG